MKIFMGVDVGKKGGIALLGGGHAEAHRMPDDIAGIGRLIRQLVDEHTVVMAAVEQVHSMPGQGVKSMFTFGQGYGAVLGVLSALSVRHTLVTPRAWQREMLDAGTGETKARSLNMARRLYPDIDLTRKADDGKADALHIARWAEKTFKEVL